MSKHIDIPINVYGINLSPQEIQDRSKWHETTYIEYEIPQKLYKKLHKIINKEVKIFEKKCNCGLCKLHKKRK